MAQLRVPFLSFSVYVALVMLVFCYQSGCAAITT